jgi:hypothetical protein
MNKTHAVFLASLLAGCGSSTSSNPPPAPEMNSVMVTAAAGGTVAAGGGSLAIPGGSLSADTMVTVSSAAPAAGTPDIATIKGKVYDFGPSGTTFSTPATLTLPAPGASAPTGQKAVISTLSEGATAWTDLPTTVAGGMLTAPVAHFSGFSVRWVVVGGANVDCAVAKAPCGGSLVGNWTFAAVCVTDGSGAAQPIDKCPTGTATKTMKVQGTANFNADLTYAVKFTQEADATFTVPASCIAATGQSPATCEDVANYLTKNTGTPTCTGSPSTACTCSITNVSAPKVTDEAGTYVTSGNTFTTTKTGDTSPGDPTSYCVDGNTNWVQITNPTGALALTK